MVAVRMYINQSEAAANSTREGLDAYYCAELLDLLQKIAQRKFKNNQILHGIIVARIASFQETDPALHAEIRVQIEESGSTKGNITSRLHQYANEFKTKKWVQKVTGGSHSRFSPVKGSGASTSARPTPSSPYSSQAMLLGGQSRSTTPTPSFNSIDHLTSEASSSQQAFLPMSGREEATTTNRTTANRVEEVVLGRSGTLGSRVKAAELPPSVEVEVEEVEEMDLDYQGICASSESLSAYISEAVVNPFLQTIRSKMTNLSDAHHIQTLFNRMIGGIIPEYQEALKKEDGQRQRSPKDQQACSTLAHLRLWVNITAALSAIEALSEARKVVVQEPKDIGSPEFSPL